VTPNDSTLKGSVISDIVYAQIDVHTGNLTAGGWTANANKLKKSVAKHTAVVADGNVLFTAGLYNGPRPARPKRPILASTPTAARVR